MKIYIMTFGLEKPRAFESAWDCAVAVEEILEKDGRNPGFRLILQEITHPEDDYSLWVVSWRTNEVIRVYDVTIEGQDPS